MGQPRDTKGMFADELEAMMTHMPLSKVRVAELCSRCGVERRVFYYHFKDKYDLVAWMFERDRLHAEEVQESYSQAYFTAAHERLWNRRVFYRRAFEEDSQNSIERYLLAFSIEANEAALKQHLGVPRLSAGLAFQARHFAYGNVGCVIDWLRGGFKATPAQLANWMFTNMPEELRKAYAGVAGE